MLGFLKCVCIYIYIYIYIVDPYLSPIAAIVSLKSSAYELRIEQTNKVVRLKWGQKVMKGKSKIVRPIAWDP